MGCPPLFTPGPHNFAIPPTWLDPSNPSNPRTYSPIPPPRDKVLVISVPQLAELSARSAPDLTNPVVVRLASHIAMKAWPSSDSGLGGCGMGWGGVGWGVRDVVDY